MPLKLSILSSSLLQLQVSKIADFHFRNLEPEPGKGMFFNCMYLQIWGSAEFRWPSGLQGSICVQFEGLESPS